MRVAGHFPDCDCVADLIARLKSRPGGAVVAEAEFVSRHGKRRLQAHWRFVKELCAGYTDVDQLGDEFVLEKLKFARKLFRTPQPVTDARPIFSYRLSAEEIHRACESGMGFLSPFDAGAWEAVGGAWQLDEYEDRREELKARELTVSDLKAMHQHDPKSLEEALGKLNASWETLSPYDRQRRWTKGRWWGSDIPTSKCWAQQRCSRTDASFMSIGPAAYICISKIVFSRLRSGVDGW